MPVICLDLEEGLQVLYSREEVGRVVGKGDREGGRDGGREEGRDACRHITHGCTIAITNMQHLHI